ncbi:MAG: hypothetical protein U9R22_00365 [Pseudomonadota bacterium]|nr:hypothetical protein [Pseudomonadota bacterium]
MKSKLVSAQGGSLQKGVAILAITILLLLVATLGTLMVGRIGLFEQKMVGTDVRSKEVYSAAIGGLEYGVNWFNEDNVLDLAWSDADGDGISCAGDTATPDPAMPDTDLNADSYAHTITYTLMNCLDQSPVIVQVSSLAVATADSHVQKTVSVEKMLGVVSTSPFGGTVADEDPSVFQGPPVMVEGCMSGVTGTPDIYPHDDLGISIGTTQGSVGCLDEGHFDLHGGTKQALAPSKTLADAVFGVVVTTFEDEQDKYEKEEDAVKAKLLALEAKNPDRILVVDDEYPRFPDDQPSWNGNNWHASLGSEEAPVILYFDREVGCPKINGGPIIWGLIYFADKDCGTHGWGNGEIHGTVALRGDMTSHTANTEIFGKSVDFGSGGGDEDGDDTVIGEPGGIFDEYRFAEIPGTWRDFEPTD